MIRLDVWEKILIEGGLHRRSHNIPLNKYCTYNKPIPTKKESKKTEMGPLIRWQIEKSEKKKVLKGFESNPIQKYGVF